MEFRLSQNIAQCDRFLDREIIGKPFLKPEQQDFVPASLSRFQQAGEFFPWDCLQILLPRAGSAQ